jgi:hypothetical protein
MVAFPFAVFCQPVCFMKTYGGSENDFSYSVQQTTDGGYIVASQADSYGAGRYDWWVLKLDEDGNGPGPTGFPALSHAKFTLYENYPNPFRHSTTIPFYLPEPGFVKLKIFNLYGQEIESVSSRYYPSGEFREVWAPEGLSGGIYLSRLQFKEMVQTGKLILLD